jgi:hypothetical protein
MLWCFALLIRDHACGCSWSGFSMRPAHNGKLQLCWHPLLSCRTYHLWPHRKCGLKLQVNCCQEGNICSSWVSSLWGRQHFIWMLNAITNWLYSPLKTWNRHLHFFIGVVCKDIILFQLFRYLSCTSGPSCC